MYREFWSVITHWSLILGDFKTREESKFKRNITNSEIYSVFLIQAIIIFTIFV